MFTGIAEGTGKILSFVRTKDGYDAQISFTNSFNDLNVNDSISCSGICLTVVHKEKNIFTVQLVKETLDKTNAKSWSPGDLINLERSLLPNTRLSGHFVQGHVDTTALITDIKYYDKSARFTFEIDKEYMKYIINKGYLSIDGLSLTVAKKMESSFEVALIPHTMKITNFHKKQISDEVNIEVDMFAKYIENYIKY